MRHDLSGRQTWLTNARSLMVIGIREAYDHLRNPLVWATVSFAVVLAAFATRVGIAELRTRQQTYQTLVSQRADDRARGGGAVSGTQIEPGLRAVRTPAPGSALVIGVDVSMPQFWDFGPAGIRSGQPNLAGGDRLIDLDLEFIIRVMLGQLAILLAVESIAGERASGALLALLGQPLGSGIVLAGKLLGAAMMLLASVIAVVLTAFAFAVATDATLATRAFVLETIAVASAGWLYLLTFFAFGQLVSIVSQSYRSALATTVTVWLILGATGAALPAVIARGLCPVQPSSILEQQAERVTLERTRRAQMAMGDAYGQRVLPNGDIARAERDADARTRALREVEPIWSDHAVALRGELAGLVTARTNELSRQRWLAKLLSFASPGAQFTAAAANLAGTGDGYLHRWEAAVRTQEGVLNQRLFNSPARLLIFVPAEPAGGPGPGGRWIVSLRRGVPPTADELPAFGEPEASAGARLADAAPSLLALALVAAGLIAAAVVAFRAIRF